MDKPIHVGVYHQEGEAAEGSNGTDPFYLNLLDRRRQNQAQIREIEAELRERTDRLRTEMRHIDALLLSGGIVTGDAVLTSPERGNDRGPRVLELLARLHAERQREVTIRTLYEADHCGYTVSDGMKKRLESYAREGRVIRNKYGKTVTWRAV